jgi:PhnB protein
MDDQQADRRTLMPTQISPMLAVSDPAAAIDFYKAAFGAIERWRIDAGGSIVAGMNVDGAEFFLASADPPRTLGPDTVGGTTVRIELFVDDPQSALDKAVAAGATSSNPVTEHEHPTVDGSSFRMLQGGVTDPFGHIWLIGTFID